jgi:hypothetical protein
VQRLKGNPTRLRQIGLTFLTLLLLAASLGFAGEKGFSIVVLPDPQHYASKYTKVGMAQTDWIRKQAKKLHVKFVVTVGDNVDSGYVDKQFENSVRFMDQLNGVVAYGVACGNHDLRDGKKNSFTSTKFVDYYGPKRFEKYPWYGGASPSGFSSYQTFTGGGIDFLALELTVAAPKTEIEWARKVIADHPDLPVILTTHQMLTPRGQIGKGTAASGPGRQTPSQVWDELIEPSPQVFLVLCGHHNGEAYTAKKTMAAQPVHVVLQDYQKEPHGGDGWLRIFTFCPDENKVDVKTYSPTLKKYKTEPASQFSFDVDFKRLAGGKQRLGQESERMRQ